MKFLSSKNICLAFGLPFVAVGVLGFFPNPLVSHDGVFEVNVMHNLLHIAVGAIFIVGALFSELVARRTLRSLSMAGIALAVLGFVTKNNLILGLIHINEADKWLHAVLAVVILAAAFGVPEPRRQASLTE